MFLLSESSVSSIAMSMAAKLVWTLHTSRDILSWHHKRDTIIYVMDPWAHWWMSWFISGDGHYEHIGSAWYMKRISWVCLEIPWLDQSVQYMDGYCKYIAGYHNSGVGPSSVDQGMFSASEVSIYKIKWILSMGSPVSCTTSNPLWNRDIPYMNHDILHVNHNIFRCSLGIPPIYSWYAPDILTPLPTLPPMYS